MAAICTCTKRFKDKYGRIYKYELAMGNDVRQFSADAVKSAIKSGLINIDNLTLTGDNKLIVSGNNSKEYSDEPQNTVAKKPNYGVLNIDRDIYNLCSLVNKYNKSKCRIIEITKSDNEAYIGYGTTIYKSHTVNGYSYEFSKKLAITTEPTFIINCDADNNPIHIKLNYNGPNETLNCKTNAKVLKLIISTDSTSVNIGRIETKELQLGYKFTYNSNQYDTMHLLNNIEANKVILRQESLAVDNSIEIRCKQLELQKSNLQIPDGRKLTLIAERNFDIGYDGVVRLTREDFIAQLREYIASGKLEIKTSFGSDAFKELVRLNLKVTLLDPENQSKYDSMKSIMSKESLLATSSILSIIESVRKDFESEEKNYDAITATAEQLAEIENMGLNAGLNKQMVSYYRLNAAVPSMKESYPLFINTFKMALDIIPLCVDLFKSDVFNRLSADTNVKVSYRPYFKCNNYEVGYINLNDVIYDKFDRYLIVFKRLDGKIIVKHIGYIGNNAPYYSSGHATYNVSNEVRNYNLDRLLSKINGITKENKIDQTFSTSKLDDFEEIKAARTIRGILASMDGLYIHNLNGILYLTGDDYRLIKCDSLRLTNDKLGYNLSSRTLTIDRDFSINDKRNSIINAINTAYANSIVPNLKEVENKPNEQSGVNKLPNAKSVILWQIAMKHREELIDLDLGRLQSASGAYTRNYNHNKMADVLSYCSSELLDDMLKLPIFAECDETVLSSKYVSSLSECDNITIYQCSTKSKVIGNYNAYGRFIIAIDQAYMQSYYITYYDPAKVLLWLKHIACGNSVMNHNWIGEYYSSVSVRNNNKISYAIDEYINLVKDDNNPVNLERNDYDPISNMTVLTGGMEINSGYYSKPKTIKRMSNVSDLAVAVDNATGRAYLVQRNVLLSNESEKSIYGAMRVYSGNTDSNTKYNIEMCTYAIAALKDSESLFKLMKELYARSQEANNIVHYARYKRNKELLLYQIKHRGNESLSEYNNLPDLAVALKPYIGCEGTLELDDGSKFDNFEVSNEELIDAMKLEAPGINEYISSNNKSEHITIDGNDIGDVDIDGLDDFL